MSVWLVGHSQVRIWVNLCEKGEFISMYGCQISLGTNGGDEAVWKIFNIYIEQYGDW